MKFAVYVAVPSGDDCELIARSARAAAPTKLRFSIREKGDPSESSDVQLYFRIADVAHSDEAIAQALQIYEIGRRAAGLKPDVTANASLAD